jgi:redox-sensitive bicupin YhaK (pirin superfamily)
MIELVIEQRRRSLGGGLEVGRVLPFAKRQMVGPYVFFDHMGPLDLAPGVDRSVDVRPHPHIGLSTVTYGGVHGQLIAGSAYGLTAGTATHSPQFYAHLDMVSGATAELPTGHAERALYIATGAVELGGVTYGAGKMLVLAPVRHGCVPSSVRR